MKKSNLFIIIATILVIIGVAVATNMNKKGKEDKIVMVTEALYEPYEFYKDGEIVGIDIEISKEIAKRLNQSLQIEDVEFSNVFNELNNNNAQFCAAGLTITDERAEQVDFSIPYITTKQVMLVKKDSIYVNLDDLKGKTISVQIGTAVEKYILDKYSNSEIIYTNSTPESITDVLLGKAEAVAMPYENALKVIEENKELRILEQPLYEAKYGIAVKKGNNELLEQINNILNQLINEGKIEEYIEMYK